VKQCRKCGVSKSHTEFTIDRKKPDSLYSYCRDCSRIKGRRLYRRLREEVLDHYGKVCACCGEDRYEFLSIDHVDGGGNAHRREIGNPSVFCRWLKKNGLPIGYRVLCMNCNHAIGRYGYCPHDLSTGVINRLG